jgi:hypothetical protein
MGVYLRYALRRRVRSRYRFGGRAERVEARVTRYFCTCPRATKVVPSKKMPFFPLSAPTSCKCSALNRAKAEALSCARGPRKPLFQQISHHSSEVCKRYPIFTSRTETFVMPACSRSARQARGSTNRCQPKGRFLSGITGPKVRMRSSNKSDCGWKAVSPKAEKHTQPPGLVTRAHSLMPLAISGRKNTPYEHSTASTVLAMAVLRCLGGGQDKRIVCGKLRAADRPDGGFPIVGERRVPVRPKSL